MSENRRSPEYLDTPTLIARILDGDVKAVAVGIKRLDEGRYAARRLARIRDAIEKVGIVDTPEPETGPVAAVKPVTFTRDELDKAVADAVAAAVAQVFRTSEPEPEPTPEPIKADTAEPEPEAEAVKPVKAHTLFADRAAALAEDGSRVRARIRANKFFREHGLDDTYVDEIKELSDADVRELLNL